ncbi:MAG: hypothetical protein IPO56_16500 [Flavobacteriales bacterium]|nr:hypothetical protein [Flavobacteriales bacterium]
MHKLNSADGMLQHVRNNLYLMRASSDDRYFIGYFHADRQSKEALTEDFNLLMWLFHGHHVLMRAIADVEVGRADKLFPDRKQARYPPCHGNADSVTRRITVSVDAF